MMLVASVLVVDSSITDQYELFIMNIYTFMLSLELKGESERSSGQ